MSRKKEYVSLPTPITLATDNVWHALITFTAGAADRFDIRSWGFYPKGLVNSDPAVELRLIKATNSGTGGAAATISKRNAFAEAVSGTAKVATAGSPFAVEPSTTGEAIDYKQSHPQGGGDWPALERGDLEIAGGEILCLQYRNNGGGAAVAAGADLVVEV